VVVFLGFSTDGFNSPTPDMAATILELSMFLLFVRGVGEWESTGKPSEVVTTVLPLLAATAITIKLSTIAFAGTILIACVVYEASASHGAGRALWIATKRLAPSTVVIAVWIASGLVLSGCPLYPSSIGCIAVDWAIPVDNVADMANWVYSWARQPGAEWHVVLGNWGWLELWLSRELTDRIGFVFPLAASIVSTILALTLRRSIRRKTPAASQKAGLIVLIPVVVAVVFWFFTAPDPRFGRVFFWILSMSATLLLLRTLEVTMAPAQFRVALAALTAVVNAPFFYHVLLNSRDGLELPSWSGPPPVTKPLVTAAQTLSGLVIYVPEQERCWDSQLPCAPYFNPNLALRVNGRIDRGFVDRLPPRGTSLRR
jgi:hypothetical protein